MEEQVKFTNFVLTKLELNKLGFGKEGLRFLGTHGVQKECRGREDVEDDVEDVPSQCNSFTQDEYNPGRKRKQYHSPISEDEPRHKANRTEDETNVPKVPKAYRSKQSMDPTRDQPSSFKANPFKFPQLADPTSTLKNDRKLLSCLVKKIDQAQAALTKETLLALRKSKMLTFVSVCAIAYFIMMEFPTSRWPMTRDALQRKLREHSFEDLCESQFGFLREFFQYTHAKLVIKKSVIYITDIHGIPSESEELLDGINGLKADLMHWIETKRMQVICCLWYFWVLICRIYDFPHWCGCFWTLLYWT